MTTHRAPPSVHTRACPATGGDRAGKTVAASSMAMNSPFTAQTGP